MSAGQTFLLWLQFTFQLFVITIQSKITQLLPGVLWRRWTLIFIGYTAYNIVLLMQILSPVCSNWWNKKGEDTLNKNKPMIISLNFLTVYIGIGNQFFEQPVSGCINTDTLMNAKSNKHCPLQSSICLFENCPNGAYQQIIPQMLWNLSKRLSIHT